MSFNKNDKWKVYHVSLYFVIIISHWKIKEISDMLERGWLVGGRELWSISDEVVVSFIVSQDVFYTFNLLFEHSYSSEGNMK